MADLDLASENLLEQGLNGAIPIGPICADEVTDCCRENDCGENQTEGPDLHFVSPELRLAPRLGRKGRHCRQWRSFHGIEVSIKPVVEANPSALRLDRGDAGVLGHGSHLNSLPDPIVGFDADQDVSGHAPARHWIPTRKTPRSRRFFARTRVLPDALDVFSFRSRILSRLFIAMVFESIRNCSQSILQ